MVVWGVILLFLIFIGIILVKLLNKYEKIEKKFIYYYNS